MNQKVEISGPFEAPIYIVSKEHLSTYHKGMLSRQLEPLGILLEKCRIATSGTLNDFIKDEVLSFPRKVLIVLEEDALEWATEKANILNWRGSVLKFIHNESLPVVPTLHPDRIIKGNWPLLLALRSDLRKVSTVFRKGYKPSERTLINVSRGATYDELVNELQMLADSSGLLSYDIEGWFPSFTCISFATSKDKAISVPLNGVFPGKQTAHLLRLIGKVLENPNTGKVAHNMLFDNSVLRRYGIGVRNVFMDTMLAHHCVFQDLPHTLAFVSSVYTWENYYKSDRKMINLVGTNLEADDYSCKDAAVTYEIVLPLLKELMRYGQIDFFFNTIMNRVKDTGLLMTQGMPRSKEHCEELLTSETEVLNKVEKQISKATNGVNPHSTKQVCDLLYNEWKMKKKYRRREKGGQTLTSDDRALREHVLSYPKHKTTLLNILKARSTRKSISTYIEAIPDGDKFFFSANIAGTPTGRYSVGHLLNKTGIPAQGIPKHLRYMITPKSNTQVIWEGDSSQAEARVVAWLAGEDSLIQTFQDGQDVHKLTGKILFGLPPNKVIGDVRNLTKIITHATNYWVGPGQLVATILKKLPSKAISQTQAKRYIAILREHRHKTYDWGRSIEHSIKSGHRIFKNCFGRMRMLLGRPDDNLVRTAIAFTPSSTVGDFDIMAMGRIQKRILSSKMNPKKNYVMNQVHDSVVGVCEKKHTEQVKAIVVEEMTQPIPLEHNGIPLIIPANFCVGPNWRDMEEI